MFRNVIFYSFAATTDNYFLTTFDLWLLVQKYEIPSIFVSTTKLLETNNKEHFFIGYGQKNDNFAFIVIPGISPENKPAFKLIETDSNDVFIALDKLLDCDHKNKINDAFKDKISVDEFLREFNPKKLEKKKLRIVDSSEDEKEPVKKAKKQPKKQLIIESSISTLSNDNKSSEIVIKKRKTKKTRLVGIKQKTKKNI